MNKKKGELYKYKKLTIYFQDKSKIYKKNAIEYY